MPKRPAKKREKNGPAQPSLPDHPETSASSPTARVLPMELPVGDRLTDETGEYEIIGLPYTTQMGKNVHVRVKRVDNPQVTMIRMYAAHERIRVKRP